MDALNRVGNTSSFLRCDLAATYVRLGRMEEARATAEDILRDQPNYRISSALLTPFKNPKVTQGFVADLKLAGLPE